MGLLDTVEAVKKSFGVGNDNVVDKVINNVQTASDYAADPVSLVNDLYNTVDAVNEAANWDDYSQDEYVPAVESSGYQAEEIQQQTPSAVSKVAETVSNAVDNAKSTYEGSQQQLADFQQALQDRQDLDLQRSKTFAENQLASQYAVSGINPYDDPLFQQNLSMIEQMEETPTVYDDLTRRLTNLNTGEVANPVDWNLLGWTSQTKTPVDAKNIYEWQFKKEDADGGNGIEHTWGKENEVPELLKWVEGVPIFGKQMAENMRKPIVKDDFIDDGSNPEAREANYMTGDRYIKYRQLGIPGRDIDQIDPNKIYSKQDEQDLYKFIPYLTSDESVDRFHDRASMDSLSNVFNNIADFRRMTSDFDIDYDGRNIKGRDFLKRGNTWANRNANAFQNVEPSLEKPSDYAIPYTWTLLDEDGNTLMAPSNKYIDYSDEDGLHILFGRTGENGEVEYPMPDQSGVLRFSNGDMGTLWSFDDEADLDRSFKKTIAEDDSLANEWLDIEPLTLGDGTKIRADIALDMLNNKDSDRYWEKNANYGFLNMGKPYIEDPLVNNEGNFDLNPANNSFVPWLVDTALGSAPYFYQPTAAAQGIANALNNSTGMKAGRQNYLDGTYNLLSENPDFGEMLTSTTGSLAMPVTEHLWGPLGGHLLEKPVMNLLKKNAPMVYEKMMHPIARTGTGVLGEALEEVPGNFAEEYQRNGVRNWYANDLYLDNNGNVTTEQFDSDGNENRVYRDSQNKVIKNPNTSGIDVARNFGADVPLSMLGGAAMGASLGLSQVPGYAYNYVYNPELNEIREFGNAQIRPDFDSNLLVNLTPEERERYDR